MPGELARESTRATTLWLCEGCGQVRESDVPLACARSVYHSGLPAMVELTKDVSWLGDPPHRAYGKTSADRGYEWLGDLGPDAVVVADRGCSEA